MHEKKRFPFTSEDCTLHPSPTQSTTPPRRPPHATRPYPPPPPQIILGVCAGFLVSLIGVVGTAGRFIPARMAGTMMERFVDVLLLSLRGCVADTLSLATRGRARRTLDTGSRQDFFVFSHRHYALLRRSARLKREQPHERAGAAAVLKRDRSPSPTGR